MIFTSWGAVVEGHGLMALVLLVPAAVFGDFRLGGSAETMGPVAAGMGASPLSVGVHGVELIFEGVPQMAIKGLESGIAPESLKPE